MKRLLAFFLFLALAPAVVLAKPSPPDMPVLFEASGFSFSPGRTCENGWIDRSFCIVTEPKAWSPSEFQEVAIWLEELPKSFLAKVQTHGFTVFYRYGHGFEKNLTGGYIRQEPLAWVWGVDRSVNISDLVFFPNVPRDPISNYNFAKRTIFHELAHAFDAGTIGQEFLDLIGWKFVNGEWVLNGIDMQDVQRTYSEVRRLGFEGLNEGDLRKVAASLRLNREYGMRYGFPTVYAMTNPSECFAEIAAHIFVDPAYSSYLKPEIVSWIKSRIATN